MNLVSRGVRNAFRNGVRTFSITIILGLSIGLALTMLVANKAVQTKINSVKSSIGNIITVTPAGAQGFQGGGEPLTTTEVDKVKSTEHVLGVTATLQDRLDSTATNLVSAIEAGSLGRRNNSGAVNAPSGGPPGGQSGNFTPPIIVTGSDSAATAQGGGALKLTSGQVYDPKVDQAVALVGSELATKNNLIVGSTLTAYSVPVAVVGIYDSGNRFGNSGLMMPLATLQRLSAQPGSVSSVTVTVDSITNLDATTQALKATLGAAADVTNQQDSSKQALEPLENIKNISLLSLAGAVVAGAVIILLTMVMIVRERRREIGVLKAIGATNAKITGQFVSEAATFTLLGAAVGLVAGVLSASSVTKLLVTSSVSATNTGGGGGLGAFGGSAARAFGLSGSSLTNIQASIGWETIAYGLLAAMLIAIVGSAVPAWLSSRIRPAEVMRAE